MLHVCLIYKAQNDLWNVYNENNNSYCFLKKHFDVTVTYGNLSLLSIVTWLRVFFLSCWGDKIYKYINIFQGFEWRLSQLKLHISWTTEEKVRTRVICF